MEEQELKQKIINIIKDVTGEEISISDDTRDIKEYVKDSMNLLRVLIEIEKTFNIKISGQDIAAGKINNLKSTIDHLKSIIK